MGGYVYLIYESDTNRYKIGATRTTIEKRMKALQTGNSSKLELEHYVYCEYPFRLENMLHQTFKSKREIGEWFNLDEDDVKNFNNACTRNISLIETMKDNPFFMKNIR